MKFGIRQCSNLIFRAKQQTKIDNKIFYIGQPVLYIDSTTTSTLQQQQSTVYA